jgi:phosphopentomutase
MDEFYLVFDDSYTGKCWSHFGRTSNNPYYGVEKKLDAYIAKLQEIRDNAITQGQIADALDAFIAQAKKLEGISCEITSDIRDLIDYCENEIDTQDKYLF